MYIQITDKCNMKCAHCAFSCTKRGSFMKLDTFKAALELARQYDESIAIGGGEPTLHPDFEKFLLLAIANQSNDFDKVFIVTNGSLKERAMMIGKLSASGVIEGKLSWDQFHDLDMIDPEVSEWFHQMGALWGPVRGTQDPIRPTNKLSKRGRAAKIKEAQDDCACEDLFIRPNGDVYQCGCPDSPKLGNVNEGYEMDGWIAHCCYHSEEYQCELEEQGK